ncbi:hypothetical protein LVY74_14880 [Acinetobacter sp. ME22]|uniref:hypothetical protein n=1 Tax=Acinetobacter sp. ME22 TaxID=2904802 RepID=UPI001EDA14B6|nr:hypothetical protein [Acinetobacter sp. ME22]MCG2574831.1 hypothetical protein [Acinetobacter sp. ME22]
MTLNLKVSVFVIALIISCRELAYAAMNHVAHPELGNLAGLFLLLAIMLIWKKIRQIPSSLIFSSSALMKESAFAFLPVCVGSLIMLFHLKDSLLIFLGILIFSTLIPLWVYALISKKFITGSMSCY